MPLIGAVRVASARFSGRRERGLGGRDGRLVRGDALRRGRCCRCRSAPPDPVRAGPGAGRDPVRPDPVAPDPPPEPPGRAGGQELRLHREASAKTVCFVVTSLWAEPAAACAVVVALTAVTQAATSVGVAVPASTVAQAVVCAS